MDTLRIDLRLALRGLRKRPALTWIAILTLALGVGANTAIFTVVHGVMLRPLGFTDEDRLVAVTATSLSEARTRPGNSLADVQFYQENQRSFSDLSFYAWNNMTLEEPGHVEQLEALYVGVELFDMLGIEPLVGRGFLPEDVDAGPGHAALISHELWQRVWGGELGVVGSAIRLDGRSITVAGVLPPQIAVPSSEAELWLPLAPFIQAQGRFARDERDFIVLGHLAPDIEPLEAELEMQRLAAQLAADFPHTNGEWSLDVTALRNFWIGETQRPLWIASGAVVLVLMLACANIAHLLLVHTAGRRRDMAVRTALGAGRQHLIRQTLLEGLLLSLAGGGIGLLLAAWLQDLLLALDPGVLPRSESIQLDVPVFVFAFTISLLTGLACSLLPALRGAAVRMASLREGDQRTTGGRQETWRQSLLAAEVALALMLLTGAGMLLRGLQDLQRVDPGFEPAGTYSAHFILDDGAYDANTARIEAFKRLREEVSGIPGVHSVALTTAPPVPDTGITIDVPYRRLDAPPLDSENPQRAAFRVITPGYFDTVGIPRFAGRDFTHHDDSNHPAVVIVNRTLAERLWGDDEAVGQRLEIAFGDTFELEVVGVVGDTRFAGLHRSPRPALFVHHSQIAFRGMAVVARTSLNPIDFTAGLRQAALKVDPLLPPGDVRSLQQRLDRSVGTERFFAVLLGLFAMLALILAAAGIFGVFSYHVHRRRQEIGVRMALGARAAQVVRMILSQGLGMTLAGIALGGLGAHFLSRTLSASFQGIEGLDPWVLLALAAVLVATAALSCLLPALKASRIDPMTTLRDD